MGSAWRSYGMRAIAMELVHGATLSGPLPLDIAIDYAQQMAESLSGWPPLFSDLQRPFPERYLRKSSQQVRGRSCGILGSAFSRFSQTSSTARH